MAHVEDFVETATEPLAGDHGRDRLCEDTDDTRQIPAAAGEDRFAADGASWLAHKGAARRTRTHSL